MSEQDIFERALRLSGAERLAFVARECGDDAVLRERIEALLAAYGRAGEFLESPAAAPPETIEFRPLSEGPGAVIGSYKLLQKIGEGGFGVVFMAEQEQPVRRQVALKVIKAGMDTREVIARFESERQALALMDHPHIAKVLDAGATTSGRPYFVMELVKGVPITEFCDRNHLPAEGRLKLFIDVCHAIQHAHHKGIIHRDIKPGNVLVTLHDGTPVVKVIDFGVAKATIQKLTERTLFTAFGQMVGTPVYMSPEQAEMSGLDIDTRTDVYSLGVLLYELLTGTTPLDIQRLRSAGYAEMQRLIREEEPPTPSHRISSLGDSATILAGNRGTDARRLSRLLSGDLDCLVLKSLEKDRNRRYATPGNFAEDIVRYLHREPIQARPPSALYKLKKFAQRNRTPVAMVSALVSVLAIGAGVSTWQAIRATVAEKSSQAALTQKNKALLAEAEQKRIAQQREREAKEAERLAVHREREEKKARELAEEINTFMRQVFTQGSAVGQASTTRQVDRSLTVKEAMDFATKNLDGRFSDRPELEAALRNTIGATYLELGAYPEAEIHLRRALELLERLHGEHHVHTLSGVNNLARVFLEKRDYKTAEALLRRALAGAETVMGAEDHKTLVIASTLAMLYLQQDNIAAAEPLAKRALAGLEKALGPDHADTLMVVNNLAQVHMAKHDYAAAEPLLRRALAGMEKRHGPNHPHTLTCVNNLSQLYFAKGDFASARQLLDRGLAGTEKAMGADHTDTINSLNNQAFVETKMGNFETAERLLKRALDTCERLRTADHPDTLHTAGNLGLNHLAAGRPAEAIPLLKRAYDARKQFPPLADFGESLSLAYHKAGRPAEAVQVVTEEVARRRPLLKPDSPELAGLLGYTGKTLLLIDPRAAEPLLRECLTICEKAAPHPWIVAHTRSLLGEALLLQKKYADAEPMLMEGYQGMSADEKNIPPSDKHNLTQALQRLIDLYEAIGKKNDADGLRQLLAELKAALETNP